MVVMNPLAQQFFKENKEGEFKAVLFLSEERDATWEQVSKMAFNLPRGWFELSRVRPEDRIEFTLEFWLDRLPYHPRAHPAFFEFFSLLDDVAVVLTRRKEDEPLEAELIYSLADNRSFFRGKLPCSEEDLRGLSEEIGVDLPKDFLAFAKIHNGFGKLSEMGLLEVGEIPAAKRRVADLLLRAEHGLKSGPDFVDPASLIPFYEVLGLSCFQCFYRDWYPEGEMGNVYLSGMDDTLSDVSDKKAWNEELAFPSFSEWLVSYLQGMNLCI